MLVVAVHLWSDCHVEAMHTGAHDYTLPVLPKLEAADQCTPRQLQTYAATRCSARVWCRRDRRQLELCTNELGHAVSLVIFLLEKGWALRP